MDFLSNRSHTCVFVMGLSRYYITDPEAVKQLLEMRRHFGTRLQLRYSTREGFHLKMFLFEGPSSLTAVVGSSNLTGGGTGGNLEANVAIYGHVKSKVMRDIRQLFSTIATSTVTSELNWEKLRKYSRDHRAREHRYGPLIRTTLEQTGDLPELTAGYADTIDDDANLIEGFGNVAPQELVWKISPGEWARQWPEWLRRIDEKTKEGIIAIGWDELGNPSELTFREIARRAKTAGFSKPKYVAQQIWSFFHQIQSGNIVVGYGHSKILGIGVVTGPATHSSGNDKRIYSNQISVTWYSLRAIRLNQRTRRVFTYPQDTLHLIKDKPTIHLIRRVVELSEVRRLEKYLDRQSVGSKALYQVLRQKILHLGNDVREQLAPKENNIIYKRKGSKSIFCGLRLRNRFDKLTVQIYLGEGKLSDPLGLAKIQGRNLYWFLVDGGSNLDYVGRLIGQAYNSVILR